MYIFLPRLIFLFELKKKRKETEKTKLLETVVMITSQQNAGQVFFLYMQLRTEMEVIFFFRIIHVNTH